MSSPRRPLRVRTIVVLVGLAALFGLLRLLSNLPEPATDSSFYTTKVVVVGVTDRFRPDAVDDKIISAHSDDVQAGAISVRPDLQGECAAAGWLTLGAGRRTTAGGLCTPSVTGSGDQAHVTDWQQRLRAAAAHSGDARLGTLAQQSPGCVQAVGPGAALAAAEPDGTLDSYRTAQQFAADSYRLRCPLTLVDAGAASDRVISALADRKDVTLVVTGIGPAPGTHHDQLQLFYRLGTTLPGLVTSETTRRAGVITLTDLTRTLVGFTLGDRPVPATAPLDGTKIQVRSQPVSTAVVRDHLAAVDHLSSVAPVGYIAGAVIGVLLAAGLVICAIRRWWSGVEVTLAGLTTLTAALMLTGAFPWSSQPRPAAALIFSLVFWVVALTVLALALSRGLKLPVAIAGAVLTMATFTTDAALGAVMQPGSLLNSRPVAGGRWYGFGNSTFGCYAAAGLVVAGYLAHRLVRSGRRWMPAIAVLAVGGLTVACEGWPSMGADFGGVISLTPTVLALALAVSGIRITWQRLVLIGAAAVLVVAAVSVIDWARGPGDRSHLGDFVQRLISGDALPIIIRKAVASGGTLIAPLGIVGVIIGAAIWVVLLRTLRHAITRDLYATYTATAVTALATAVIGTLLNDAGISVFLTITGPFAASTVGLLYHRYRPYGWRAVVDGVAFADRPTPVVGRSAVRRGSASGGARH